MNPECLICDRIDQIAKGTNRTFVCELSTGFVVFGDYQFYPGYSVFLSKYHKNELHQLDRDTREIYLVEMACVAEALHSVFKPVKLNYELLGNKDEHMHWHLYPRYENDPDRNRPIWSYPKELRCNKETAITPDFINKYKTIFSDTINHILRLERSK